MKIRLIQDIIDLIRGKKQFPFVYKYERETIHKNYSKTIQKYREKINNGEKIRVAFFSMYSSDFASKSIYEKMRKDPIFDPYFLVIPDIIRGDENMFYQMKKTYKILYAQYNNVYYAYDFDKKKFIDWSDKYDIVCFDSPYDHMTHKFYTVEYAAKKNILSFYVNYGTMPDYYAREHIINQRALNFCWKVYTDTKENYEDVLEYTDIKGKNAVLSGYCKMDRLNNIEKKELERKKIIISPHHTVGEAWDKVFGLSNFLRYSDFFLELPQKYPQVDFVFRPHPLLFVTLSREDYWGKEKVTEYINKITAFPNVEYQDGGEYFETFVNSSAIIHDCSSFIMEYLYTGHPACYMLKNEKEVEEIFAPIGQQCLENYYHAFNKEDIINFIENVVLSGNDPMKETRIKFAKEKIMLNYPNVSDFIINNIKEELR